MLRLIRCNESLLGNEDALAQAESAIKQAAVDVLADDDDEGDSDGPSHSMDRAYVFSSKNMETSYLAEAVLCYVSIVSQLSAGHLDDMVLDRLCDLVEQLIAAFPNMVSSAEGARCVDLSMAAAEFALLQVLCFGRLPLPSCLAACTLQGIHLSRNPVPVVLTQGQGCCSGHRPVSHRVSCTRPHAVRRLR